MGTTMKVDEHIRHTRGSERVMAAFERCPADRVPIYTHVNNVAAIEAVTGSPIERDPLRVSADAIRAFGIDLTAEIVLPHFGVVREPRCIYQEAWMTASDGSGESGFAVEWRGFDHWVVERPFRSTQEAYAWAVENWRPRPIALVRNQMYRRIETRRAHQELLGDGCMLIHHAEYMSLESIYHPIGLDAFSFMLYDEPGAVSEILDGMLENALRANEVLLAEDPTPIMRFGDDLAFKSGPIVSPAWLRREYFPRQQQLADQLKAAGVRLLFHSCGNITSLVPDLLALGIDALQPLEVTAGVDLADLKRRYGDRLVLMGNVDTNVIQRGSAGEVKAEVRRCIDQAAAGGGFFLETAGGFGDLAPAENVLAFFEEAHTYGRY
jgi:hypothetical protein